MKVAVGTKFLLEVNASAILSRLRAARRASVSALAKETGLSRQAVTRSLAVLDTMGLVEVSAPERAATGAGRPAQMVSFRAGAGHVLGIDVQPGQARIVVADLAGDPVAESSQPLSRAGSGALAASLTAAIGRALAGAGLTPGDIWHVTAAAPGIVDPASGRVTLSFSMPETVGDAIPAGIRDALGCPLYVDNDVKLATEGERWRGTPHAEDSLVFVDWGERIGAGIVLRGELYRGASNDAGDLGYLDLLAPATGLPAGQAQDADLGAFERWVGTRELLRLAGVRGVRPVTLPALAEDVRRGEEWALAAVRVVAARFAKGIAAVRALLDPEVVIIGGDIAVLGQPLLDAVDDALRAEPLSHPRLELSTLGADAIRHGAVRHSLTWVERERFAVPAIASRHG
jgi:predicted NBD/HSP70 family sugar kinase/DNA-binding transcriptional ArsR family regulator